MPDEDKTFDGSLNFDDVTCTHNMFSVFGDDSRVTTKFFENVYRVRTKLQVLMKKCSSLIRLSLLFVSYFLSNLTRFMVRIMTSTVV